MSGSNLLLGAAALAGLVLVGAQLRTGQAPPAPQSVSAPQPAAAPAAPAGNGIGAVAFVRAPDSHFYADALVNGAPVRFIVDTGSTQVVLTGADARRAGIGAGDYSARAVGAGGEVKLMPARAARLALGPIAADNVPVMVAEDGRLPVSLLGQSFLGRVGTVTIQGDTMTLR
jgi:aspartyl protease family protein